PPPPPPCHPPPIPECPRVLPPPPCNCPPPPPLPIPNYSTPTGCDSPPIPIKPPPESEPLPTSPEPVEELPPPDHHPDVYTSSSRYVSDLPNPRKPEPYLVPRARHYSPSAAQYAAPDITYSKRRIQQAAEQYLGTNVNVICGNGVFAYVVHTREFCQHTVDDLTCYVFQPT
ncbi:unnamed protein product, partial [Enterobius vermicularis]|uniref:Ground-like domain-containing protein n=1 Tax=Enterobius vermicularis TaxID=51028 RepID=A0A0N4VA76_ENTVE